MIWLVILGIGIFLSIVFLSAFVSSALVYFGFNRCEIKIKKYDPNREYTVPTKGSDDAAAFDLYVESIEDSNGNYYNNYTISPGETIKIHTNIKMELPVETYLDICSRSGLSINHGIVVVNSPARIDSDYRGEIIIGLHNTSTKPYNIIAGDRVAQSTLHNLITVSFKETDEELTSTERSEGGLGHSGYNKNIIK